MLLPLAGVAGTLQGGIEDVAVLGAAVALVDLVLKELRFPGEGHGAALDDADALGGGEDGVTVGIDSDGANVVAGQPAEALAVFPILAVVADGADLGAEPDRAVLAGDEGGEVVVGETIGAGVEFPLPVLAAGALGAGEPEAAPSVEGDAADVVRRPTAAGVPGVDGVPATGGQLEEQAGEGGDGDAAVGGNGDLADRLVGSVQPCEAGIGHELSGLQDIEAGVGGEHRLGAAGGEVIQLGGR